MWMIELATNTSTEESRIGSHSADNAVIATSHGMGDPSAAKT
jgi:hypothetical protein